MFRITIRFLTILSLTSLQGIQVVEPDFIRRPIGDFYAHSAESVVESPAPPRSLHPVHQQTPCLLISGIFQPQRAQAWDYLESLGLPAGGSHDITIAVIDTGVDYLHPTFPPICG